MPDLTPTQIKLLNHVEEGDVVNARSMLEERPELINFDTGVGSLLHAGIEDAAMVEMLLGFGIDLEFAYELIDEQVTAAMTAITEDQPESLALILEAGANLPPNRELTKSIVGDKQHSLELIQILHKHGADLHEVFEHGSSNEKMNALSYAILYDRKDVIAYLTSKGCELPTG